MSELQLSCGCALKPVRLDYSHMSTLCYFTYSSLFSDSPFIIISPAGCHQRSWLPQIKHFLNTVNEWWAATCSKVKRHTLCEPTLPDSVPDHFNHLRHPNHDKNGPNNHNECPHLYINSKFIFCIWLVWHTRGVAQLHVANHHIFVLTLNHPNNDVSWTQWSVLHFKPFIYTWAAWRWDADESFTS